MSTRRQREFLKAQIVELDRLLESIGDHPLMSPAYRRRKEELENELSNLLVGDKESRTVLFFTGQPIQGSLGIDAGFASRILFSFQNMVSSGHAYLWHDAPGSRGRRGGEKESRLLLTGLPRGSFGLELSNADDVKSSDENQLIETLTQVTRLIASAGRSDEDFATALDMAPDRVIKNLRDFLKTIAKGQAGLRMESGDFRFALSPAQASKAYERVTATTTQNKNIEEKGVFKGLLLESRHFDFTNDAEKTISGKLDDNLTPGQASKMLHKYLERPCIASMLKTTVRFKTGHTQASYRLKGLRDVESAESREDPN